MKNRLQGLILGILIGALVTSGIVFAEQITQTAQLFYNDIKIDINGSKVLPKDANGNYVEPFIINGTTYLPVRAVANALGIQVDWDDNTNTVLLSYNTYNTNKDGYIPTILEVAEMNEMTIDEFKEEWGLPSDMPGDTMDTVAQVYVSTAKFIEQSYGMTYDQFVEVMGITQEAGINANSPWGMTQKFIEGLEKE